MKKRRLLWMFAATVGVIVAGCKDNAATDQPAPESEPTPEPEPVAAYHFNFKDITSSGATIEVTPEDNSTYYTWDVMTSENFRIS